MQELALTMKVKAMDICQLAKLIMFNRPAAILTQENNGDNAQSFH